MWRVRREGGATTDGELTHRPFSAPLLSRSSLSLSLSVTHTHTHTHTHSFTLLSLPLSHLAMRALLPLLSVALLLGLTALAAAAEEEDDGGSERLGGGADARREDGGDKAAQLGRPCAADLCVSHPHPFLSLSLSHTH